MNDCAQPEGRKGELPRKSITFSLVELWMLNDVVRHECSQIDTWKYPPVDRELNKEIALAIAACVDDKLTEYTLELTEHQMLVIDFNIRRSMKTPEGAFGEQILLKVFRAIGSLGWTDVGIGSEQDETFKQAKTRTERSVKKDADDNNVPESD